MEFNLDKLLDHLIQAVVTIAIAAIPAYLGYLLQARRIEGKAKETVDAVEHNTDETVQAKNAARAAVKQGIANHDSINEVKTSITHSQENHS